ncbi:MAG: xylS, partial [Paenibacillus sp.]|nr:xylS [Paenibacillus sp.]
MTSHVQFQIRDGSWIRIQPTANHTFRFRLSETDDFHEPPLLRYGIVSGGWRTTDFVMDDEERHVIIRTSQAVLKVDKQDGTFVLSRYDEEVLICSAAPPSSDALLGFEAQFKITDEEKFYGLGDQTTDRIQKRGLVADMRIRRKASQTPIPFLMSSKGWALFINTTWSHIIDIGCSIHDRLCFRGDKGEMDFYLIAGENYDLLLDRYTDLVGKPVLLPIWAYGLNYLCNQYANAREVIEDALNFRREDIPCDLIGLEPGWMERWYDHSTEKKWHPERFSIPNWSPKGPRTFMGSLERMGFKLSLWLCCNYDLSHYEESLVAGQTEHSGTEGEASWYTHLQKFVNQGVSAFKLEGNFFEKPSQLEWANNMSSGEVHNLYPLLLCKQMHHGFKEQTGRRALIYSMTGYAGVQQYAATWTGFSGEGSEALSSLLGHGFSGHVNAVCDMEIYSPSGIHFGFLQTLSQVNSFAYWQHPSLLDNHLLKMFRLYAKLRYSLLPYIYSTAHVASRTGMPLVRAMPLCFPEDPRTDEQLHQYLLGDHFLVAVFTKQVYLPIGRWIDYWTGEYHVGPKEFEYVTPEHVGGPLFVRSGAIIPTWPEMSFIDQRLPERIGVHIYPYATAEYTFYEDDGITYQYLDHKVTETKMYCTVIDGHVKIQIDARIGSFEGMPEKRSYELFIHVEAKPFRVSVNGIRLAEMSRSTEAILTTESWFFDRTSWQVQLCVEEDPFKQTPLHIEVMYDATDLRTKQTNSVKHTKEPKRQSQEEELVGDVQSKVGVDKQNDKSRTWEKELEISLVSGDIDKAYAALEKLWGDHLDIELSKNEIREHLLDISGLLVRTCERTGLRIKEVADEDYVHFLMLPDLESKEEAYSLLRRIIQRFVDCLLEFRRSSLHPLIQQVIAIVEQEINTELTLQ